MRVAALVALAAMTAPGAGSNGVVTVQAPAATLAPGASVEVHIGVTVKDGFHVQANPPSDALLIPVRLDLQGDDAISVSRIAYPAGRSFHLNGSDRDLLVYDGRFEVVVTLAATHAAKPGEHVLRGKVGYQACDAKSCRPPTSTPLTLSLRVSG